MFLNLLLMVNGRFDFHALVCKHSVLNDSGSTTKTIGELYGTQFICLTAVTEQVGRMALKV